MFDSGCACRCFTAAILCLISSEGGLIVPGVGFPGAVGITESGFSFRCFVFRGFDSSCSRRATKRKTVLGATVRLKFSDRILTISLNAHQRWCNLQIRSRCGVSWDCLRLPVNPARIALLFSSIKFSPWNTVARRLWGIRNSRAKNPQQPRNNRATNPRFTKSTVKP